MTALHPLLRAWPLALVLLAFTAGWTVNGWRWEARHAAALQAQLDARMKAEQDANAKSAELEARLAEERKWAIETARRLDRELQNAAYACRVPDGGVLILRDAVAGHPAGKPDRPVP
jgi:hypothetical protein